MGRFSMGSGGSGGLTQGEVEAIADAAEAAAATYTDTVTATYAASNPYAIAFRSGELYTIANHGGLTAGTANNRTSSMLPFRPAKACTLNKVAVDQTVAGEAGSLIRLAIVEDSDGYPTTVLSQTSIAGDGANGEKSYDPDLAIVPSKLYYVLVGFQAAVTTRPTLRQVQTAAFSNRQFLNGTFTSSGRHGISYSLANDSALPTTLLTASLGVSALPLACSWLRAD